VIYPPKDWWRVFDGQGRLFKGFACFVCRIGSVVLSSTFAVSVGLKLPG
jgi:hypothetical protein